MYGEVSFTYILRLLLTKLLRKCYFLQTCMNHILAVLRQSAELRSSGFIALGEMAGALDGELFFYLGQITPHLREAVCQHD